MISRKRETVRACRNGSGQLRVTESRSHRVTLGALLFLGCSLAPAGAETATVTRLPELTRPAAWTVTADAAAGVTLAESGSYLLTSFRATKDTTAQLLLKAPVVSTFGWVFRAADRWLAFESNRTASAWVLRHEDERRPWVLCIHGFGTGSGFMDLFSFRPRWSSWIVNKILVGTYYPEEKHPISRLLFRIYEPPARLVLKHPKTTIVIALILVATTVPVYLRLGSEFMPPLNEGTILYMPTTLPGISVSEAQTILQHQDQILRRHFGLARHALIGPAADVRRDDGVRTAEQHMIFRRRFLFQHVSPVAE